MREKIIEIKELKRKIKAYRNNKSTIAFTNGCFDILHAGHVRYLIEAKLSCDILILGLNSDKSVTAIKGEGRPIVPQEQRAEVLAGLTCVDHIVLFDEPDPYNLITEIIPDILVKGEDWTEDKIIGADVVKNDGGKVLRIPFTQVISTSKIIDRIISLNTSENGK